MIYWTTGGESFLGFQTWILQFLDVPQEQVRNFRLYDSEGRETLPSQPACRIDLPVTSSQPPICQIFSPTARFLSTWTSRNANVSLFLWPTRKSESRNIETSLLLATPLFLGMGILGTFWFNKTIGFLPFPMPFTSRCDNDINAQHHLNSALGVSPKVTNCRRHW